MQGSSARIRDRLVALGSRYWIDLLIAAGVFALTLAIYNTTLTPSLSYQSPDGNELATVCYQLGLAHSTGYPLYTWLGKLFTLLPVGDIAHRVNLMSAVMAAGAVALLYAILRQLTGRRIVSALVSLYFGFAVTFWSQAVIAEVYAPNAFMLALCILLILCWARTRRSRYILAFALAYGLSLGTHLSNLGFAPAYALFVLLVDWRVLKRPREVFGALGLFVLGCLQFLWLPYKASMLVDLPMARNAPVTLESFYRYTLGAFPQMKFAFPLAAIPDRIVIYLELLRRNLGLVGIVLGILGMWAMLFKDTEKLYLLISMYLVHVVFFIQYRVFDLDVFFIPAHLLFLLFLGYGLHWLLCLVEGGGGRAFGEDEGVQALLRVGVTVVAALLLVVGVGRQLHTNWDRCDRSEDVAINDFYENVFELLPADSVLLGRGGVFGYDMFYFRYVYDVRPDVAMPMAVEGGRPQQNRSMWQEETHVYSTEHSNPGGSKRTPWSVPPELIGPQTWYVPCLAGQSGVGMVGGQRRLVLYELTDEPPELVVTDADPQHEVNHQLGGLELVGYDLDETQVAGGGCLGLTLYWRVRSQQTNLVGTALGDVPLEAHNLGLGNLGRYIAEVQPPRSGMVVEEYAVVVPSSLEPGEYDLKVGAVDVRASVNGQPGLTDSVTLTQIEVGE